MRGFIVATVAATAMLTACGGSGGPTRLWQVSGFNNPESALPDTSTGVIYVSNVAGKPDDKDGVGFISKLSIDGKLLADKWVTGLNAPKGLALVGSHLFVADIDRLVEIDTETGKIVQDYPAPDAKLLNDVAADGDGHVYVSDWVGNAIWRLADGNFEQWVESPELKSPNGLLVEGDKLIVATWGDMEPDYSTKVGGNLLTIGLESKEIATLGDGKPVGNLDGLEPFDAESYIVTDFMAGKVYQITRSGAAKELLTLSLGSADLGYVPGSRTAIIPVMMEDKVVAYKF